MIHSAPVYSSPVHSISLGATASYESPVIETNFDAYASDQYTVESNQVVQEQPASTPAIESERESTVSYEAKRPSFETEPVTLDEADAGMLLVSLPLADATLTVNGHKTTSDGMIRQFKSRGLKDGFVYTYVVDVTYDVNGKPLTDSREVKLRSGQIEEIIFEAPEGMDAAAEETQEKAAPVADTDLVTVVKLHVPENAKVILAGNPTNGSGAVRTFRTTQLKAGESWSNYTVHVTADINGQRVSRERTLEVSAGSNNEVLFDFNSLDVAQN